MKSLDLALVVLLSTWLCSADRILVGKPNNMGFGVAPDPWCEGGDCDCADCGRNEIMAPEFDGSFPPPSSRDVPLAPEFDRPFPPPSSRDIPLQPPGLCEPCNGVGFQYPKRPPWRAETPIQMLPEPESDLQKPPMPKMVRNGDEPWHTPMMQTGQDSKAEGLTPAFLEPLGDDPPRPPTPPRGGDMAMMHF